MHQSSSLYIEALWPNQETPTWTRWRRRRGKWWQWWAAWRQGWQGLEDNCERPPNFKKEYISSQLSLSILFHLDFSLLCSSTWFERSDICLLLSSSQSEDMPQPIPISDFWKYFDSKEKIDMFGCLVNCTLNAQIQLCWKKLFMWFQWIGGSK